MLFKTIIFLCSLLNNVHIMSHDDDGDGGDDDDVGDYDDDHRSGEASG